MKLVFLGLLVSGLVVVTTSGRADQNAAPPQQAPPPAPYPAPVITPEEFDRWMKELSNWGRWGADDQRGALNLITAAKRKQAHGLVQQYMSVSLAHQSLMEKAVDNPEPLERTVTSRFPLDRGVLQGALDAYEVHYHGFAHSHLDALCHALYQGRMYNGFPASDITKENGCSKGSVVTMQDGIVTRGILLDMPRLKNLPYLEPGTPVYAEDLEAWEKKAGIKVGPGDAIFLYTGRWAARAKLGPFRNLSGYHGTVAKWLKARDVAVVASDTVNDIALDPKIGLPIHTFALAGLGAPILDNLDLEALAATAARLKRWEFMISVAPVPMPGGTGSLVNPIATF